VADLHGQAARALDEAPVHHEPAADAGAEEHGGQVVRAGELQPQVLAPGDGVDVVEHDHGDAQLGFETVGQRDVGPVEVGGPEHAAVIDVHHAGDRDPDGVGGRVQIADLPAHDRRDLIEITRAEPARLRPLADGPLTGAHQPAPHVGAAQIQSRDAEISHDAFLSPGFV